MTTEIIEITTRAQIRARLARRLAGRIARREWWAILRDWLLDIGRASV